MLIACVYLFQQIHATVSRDIACFVVVVRVCDKIGEVMNQFIGKLQHVVQKGRNKLVRKRTCRTDPACFTSE